MKKKDNRTENSGYFLSPKHAQGTIVTPLDSSAEDNPTENSSPGTVSGSHTSFFDPKSIVSLLKGVFIYDPQNGKISFINPHYTDLTGYSLDDLQGLNGAEFQTLIHPDDRKRVAKYLGQVECCRDDETLEIDCRFKTADGGWLACLLRTSVFERDANGRVRQIIGTLMDIAELKTFETALENEVLIRKSLETQLRQWSQVSIDAADPIIIEDLSGRIIDMNRVTQTEYGWKPNELIGKSILSLIPGDHHQRARGLRKHCYRGEEIRNWEGVRQDQKGQMFSVLITAFPLRDDSGEVISIATIARDITLRKEMEAELEKSQYRLRNLSRKSIEILENDRKTTAKELHDGIAASLAAVKFQLEDIAQEIARKPQKAADSLNRSISYLQAVIKETKLISAKLRPTTLDDLGLLSTITWYTRQFSKQFRDIQVVPRIDVREEDIPETLKIVIYRVLQEALRNAARHSKADQISIHLTRKVRQIILEVVDNGCGFDVQKELDRKDPLSGYGLASMTERAELVNGTLSIDSSPGQGSCIRMTLSHSPFENTSNLFQ